MKILNIGIPELIFILVIALIVLGPNGIVKTARTLGKTIRKVIRSPIWSMMLDTQRELREMPTKLVREAGLEEDLAELRKTSREVQQTTRGISQTPPVLPHPRSTPPLNLPIENNAQPTGSTVEEDLPADSETQVGLSPTETTTQENQPVGDPPSLENE